MLRANKTDFHAASRNCTSSCSTVCSLPASAFEDSGNGIARECGRRRKQGQHHYTVTRGRDEGHCQDLWFARLVLLPTALVPVLHGRL